MSKKFWKKKRKVIEGYVADIYDVQYAEEQDRKYSAALDDLKLEFDDLVLDVGCGTGLLAAKVANRVGWMVGADGSKEMLKRAKERLDRVENAYLVRSDADYLPFQDSVFTRIFAITLIQNVPNPLITLKEMQRVARKGSIIVVTCLKKKLSYQAFKELLKKSKLNVLEIKGDEEIKDFVAICLRGA